MMQFSKFSRFCWSRIGAWHFHISNTSKIIAFQSFCSIFPISAIFDRRYVTTLRRRPPNLLHFHFIHFDMISRIFSWIFQVSNCSTWPIFGCLAFCLASAMLMPFLKMTKLSSKLWDILTKLPPKSWYDYL